MLKVCVCGNQTLDSMDQQSVWSTEDSQSYGILEYDSIDQRTSETTSSAQGYEVIDVSSNFEESLRHTYVNDVISEQMGAPQGAETPEYTYNIDGRVSYYMSSMYLELI